MTFLTDMSKNDRDLAYGIKDVVENFDSGKQPSEVKVTVSKQKKRISLSANVQVFQAFAYLSATKLKPATNRILMLLFAQSAYENFIGMDVKTIAEELEMSERSVVRGLNELEENNIIIKYKHPSDKRRHDYFLNPTAAWKGNSFTRMKAIKASDPDQLKMFPESG